MKIRAYIDIETTGLSRNYCQLTVVGIWFDCGPRRLVQLVGEEISANAISKSLASVDEIYSYNGSRFDLPFIKAKLGLDLKKAFTHTDLMYACWKKDLKGGLKAVERKLGIERKLKDIDGFMAVRLWWDYINRNDKAALATLLAYNEEDVANLVTLRKMLGIE